MNPIIGCYFHPSSCPSLIEFQLNTEDSLTEYKCVSMSEYKLIIQTIVFLLYIYSINEIVYVGPTKKDKQTDKHKRTILISLKILHASGCVSVNIEFI